MAKPKDIIAELEHDHREVEKLFTKVVELRKRPRNERTRERTAEVFECIRRELSMHAAAEEMVLYPELRTAMPGRGAKLADEGLEEHDGVKRALADLQGMTPGEPAFDRRMDDLMREVGHHVDEEEREILGEMPKHLPPERLRELGKGIARAKSIAPTHPHPMAPNRPPANVVAGLVVGAFDRLRDALNGSKQQAGKGEKAASSSRPAKSSRKPAVRAKKKLTAGKKTATKTAPRAKPVRRGKLARVASTRAKARRTGAAKARKHR